MSNLRNFCDLFEYYEIIKDAQVLETIERSSKRIRPDNLQIGDLVEYFEIIVKF